MKIITKTTTLEEMGGKGYQLSLLSNFCQVPKFFVIAFDTFDEINNKKNQEEILEYFDKFKFKIVAVRSSANKEDSLLSSFAGMFETTLNVTKEKLIEEIKQILNSCNNDRVKEYCSLNNIEYKKVKMRIVIQEMIGSRISGVCFSKVDKEKSNLIIEAGLGLGEAIVSGAITPDLYVVNTEKLNIVETKINYQGKMLKRHNNMEKYEDVPFYQRYIKKMTNKEIEEVAKEVLKIEKKLKYKAADVEWAYDGDKLYILQARQFTGVQ